MTFWNVNIANGNHDTPEKISITRVANFTGFAQSELGFTWQKILRGEFGRWGNITAEAKWKLWITLTSLVMWVLLWRTGWCSWLPLWFGSFGAPYFAAVSCEFSSCHHCCKHIIFFFSPNVLNIDCFCTQDRSPKTQSQVRRMIEAGQVDRRAPQPSSPPSSTHIDHETTLCNTPTQSPTVEKCEIGSTVI